MKLEQEKPSTIRTNTDFVVHCENMLGFVLPADKPPWKARMVEAGKLKRKRAQNSRLYSMDNLVLTVEWLRQHKKEAKSPAAVCWFVEDALKNARSDGPSDMNERISAAIQQASSAGLDEWVTKLSRARGKGRSLVLEEWERR